MVRDCAMVPHAKGERTNVPMVTLRADNVELEKNDYHQRSK